MRISDWSSDVCSSDLFNNAAQVWNHTFFWHCMSPKGGGAPKGELAERIKRDFGSLDDFKKKFADIAGAQLGSGWAWLVDDSGTLRVGSRPEERRVGEAGVSTCHFLGWQYY